VALGVGVALGDASSSEPPSSLHALSTSVPASAAVTAASRTRRIRLRATRAYASVCTAIPQPVGRQNAQQATSP
jgi:hypothetical protein